MLLLLLPGDIRDDCVGSMKELGLVAESGVKKGELGDVGPLAKEAAVSVKTLEREAEDWERKLLWLLLLVGL